MGEQDDGQFTDRRQQTFNISADKDGQAAAVAAAIEIYKRDQRIMALEGECKALHHILYNDKDGVIARLDEFDRAVLRWRTGVLLMIALGSMLTGLVSIAGNIKGFFK